MGSPFKAKVQVAPGWGEVSTLGWKPILGWLQWLFTSRAELAPISVFRFTRNKVGLALHNVPFSTFYVWTCVHHFKNQIPLYCPSLD